MARLRVLHWKEAEAKPLLSALRAAGHQLDFHSKFEPGLSAVIRSTNPHAIVIDLSCRPSHGRELAVYLRGAKSTRHIPIVFVDGEAEKVEKIRELLPDAMYTTTARVAAAVKRAVAKPPVAPVVPPQMMERMAGRPTALKMGIKEGSRVGLFSAPSDYERALGEMPEGVSLEEDPDEVLPVSIWFVRDAEEYVRGLPRKRALAARSRFWVVWPKGQRNGITQFVIRQAALDLGLVDYKICSVNEVWTAMLFAVKKS